MPKLKYTLPVYPFHIDAIGHVNNIVYVEWMEVGRVHLLHAVDMPIERITQDGFGSALVETNISYQRPLYLGDTVNATIWLSQLRKASAVMAFEFCNQHSEVAAVGSQRGLFIDLDTQKPRRITAEQRSRFSAYLIEADA